jgi:hypothetical protein
MALVKQKHLNLYKTYIEQLTADLGQKVSAVTDTVSSACTNCFWNKTTKSSSGQYNGTGPKSFSSGICPVCKGDGELSTSVAKTLVCIVNWINPTDADEFELTSAGQVETNVFKIKTYIRHYSDIKNADYLIIEGVRCRLLNIIKRGLRDNVMCEALCVQDE